MTSSLVEAAVSVLRDRLCLPGCGVAHAQGDHEPFRLPYVLCVDEWVFGSFVLPVCRKESMGPDPSMFWTLLGRSLDCAATSAAPVPAALDELHAASMTIATRARNGRTAIRLECRTRR